MLPYEQTETMDIWGAYHRSDEFFLMYQLCGHVIPMWLVGDVNPEQLVKVVFVTDVLVAFLGLFENYILIKLKSSVKIATIRKKPQSVALKKEMERDTSKSSPHWLSEMGIKKPCLVKLALKVQTY